MKKISLFFLLLTTGPVLGQTVCPSGFVEMTSDAWVLVQEGESCPSGYSEIPLVTSASGSPHYQNEDGWRFIRDYAGSGFLWVEAGDILLDPTGSYTFTQDCPWTSE